MTIIIALACHEPGELDLPMTQRICLVEAGRKLLLTERGSSSAIGVTASMSNLPTEALTSVPAT